MSYVPMPNISSNSKLSSKVVVGSLSHCFLNMNGAAASNGTDVIGTYRKKHTILINASDIVLQFGNCQGDVATTAPVMYTASIEYPSGTIWPVTFNGALTVTVNPGGVAYSDPIGIDVVQGQDFWTRTCPHVSALAVWPCATKVTTFVAGEGYTAGADNTLTAGTGWVTSVNVAASFPMKILGTPQKSQTGTFVWIAGDSQIAGVNDVTAGVVDRGWCERALNNQVPYTRTALSGERTSSFTVQAQRAMRMRNVLDCNVMISNYGTNDLAFGSTLAQIQGFLQTVWGYAIARNMKAYQSTITPRGTSSDNFMTGTGQTPLASESIRTQLNDWIRTVPAPLNGYLEIADVCEVNVSTGQPQRNSGIWPFTGVANYATPEGIHQSTALHILCAAAVQSQILNITYP